MPAITTSVFDLFKVGPGPSSSHTIGPMKAAYDFRQRVLQLTLNRLQTPAIEVDLYGSLSATGKGHGTDRAIVAGLLGWLPETCDPQALWHVLGTDEQACWVMIGAIELLVTINFHHGLHTFPFSNTVIFRLVMAETTGLTEEYYSVGGGFIQRKGETIPPVPSNLPYPYTTMNELKQLTAQHDITLSELILTNEMALTQVSRAEVEHKLDDILTFMIQAVQAGLATEGVLPGTIKLQRKAAQLLGRAQVITSPERFLVLLNAYCLAASEENAAGHRVVTAPTSGASGVIPGLVYFLQEHYHVAPESLREGLLAAAAIGFLVKQNASISGAEMGCMGEVGTASAMGAALITHSAGYPITAVEVAAEIAIEHHLGMTCDPIGGYVQIPCIERNAMGAVKAYNAYLLATSGNHTHQKISLDRVISVMRATGQDMSKKYKETSEAGLALSSTEC